jgi:predicted DNA-binding transcriptional regulator YafY
MADTPAARLLSLLELLQSRPSATGAELAEALGVTERSLRRYIQRLVDLGIPVDSERGPYGGYRLRPRFRLPPLMLSAEEAVAVTLGLLVARPLGVGTAVPAAASALAKLQRVLPDALRERVRALGDSLGVVLPASAPAEIDPRILTELGAAAHTTRSVTFDYRSFRGETTTRTVDPYGLVFHARCWYLVAHDHLRSDLRTFRVDRIGALAEGEDRFTRPEGFDAVDHLVRTLAAVPYAFDVEVVLHTDVEEARRRIAPTMASVEPHADGAVLRLGADSLDWAARYLVDIALPFTVVRPDALRDALRDLARQLEETAERAAPPPWSDRRRGGDG